MEKTANDVAEQLRRSAQLRKSLEGVDRDVRVGQIREGRRGRLLGLVSRLVTLAVLGVLVTDGLLAYGTFVGHSRDDGASGERGSPDARVYQGLEIFRGTGGDFAGRVTLTNPGDGDVWVLVEVDLYNEEQYVGKVTGDVPLKANSTSGVELSGFDDYSAYTNSRVHLDGFPRG